ncbi:YoaK family protein [Hyphomicrobium sp. CS1GBMeth3]|uniref:YoaK family protein n=1 Tax=Hyphomicrobium sp. CS1GBMeth3 TaxID=1892845 RepID=UPI000930AF55|nr:YoaK family protein [Hyphomicrobium sp. CS1GBMeth3]
MKLSAPTLLSFNGGYVDTAGFLALHGLFATHVTGNFVTFGASLAYGTSGALTKLLALPVFCIVVMLVRLLGAELPKRGLDRLRELLFLKVVLLAVTDLMAFRWGPFVDGDAWRAIFTGLTLVAAMAVQNAVHRVHLPKSPPSTIMTGNATQMMIDIPDLVSGNLPADKRQVTLDRVRALASGIAMFALGCAAAAMIFLGFGMWVFVLPPVIGLASALVAKSALDAT